MLGGGAFNASDPEAAKSAAQRRVEAELGALLDDVVARDFPFLGACYGIGALGTHQGGIVDRAYPEPVGPLSVTLTDAGKADPLFAGLPDDFAAYGGHKEALRRAAARDAVLLAALGRLPGAGLPGGQQRLRHPVPPRARPRTGSAPGSTSTGTPATSSRTRPTC